MAMKHIVCNNIRKDGSRRGTLTLSATSAQWSSAKGQFTETVNFQKTPLDYARWAPIGPRFELRLSFEDPTKVPICFAGFTQDDLPRMKTYIREVLGTDFKRVNSETNGQNWGFCNVTDDEVQFLNEEKNKMIVNLPMNLINKVTKNGDDELSIDLKQTSMKINLGEIRLYIPEQGDINAAAYADDLTKKAHLDFDTDEIICSLSRISFRTPRGKFDLDFFPDFLLLASDTLRTTVSYETIKRCFSLEQPNGKVALVISVDPPVRQGQTLYDFLLCEFPKDLEHNCAINATDEELKNEYADRNGQQILNQTVEGTMTEILVSLFGCLAKTKTISHSSNKAYSSNDGEPCLSCSLKANRGLLYPLAKSFFFIHKPPTFIRYSQISWIRFEKIGQKANIKNFDLTVHVDGTNHVFMNIPIDFFSSFFRFCSGKDKLNILNGSELSRMLKEDEEMDGRVRKSVRIQNNDALRAMNMIDDEEDSDGSEDDDFDANDLDTKEQLQQDAMDDEKYHSDDEVGESEEDDDDDAIDFPKKRKREDEKDEGSNKRARI